MSNSQQWLPFADASTHFDTLHGQHDHCVAVCTSVEGKQWSERVYEHDLARSMAGNLVTDFETYLSQSGLGKRRKAEDVRALTGHWIDLDIKGTEFECWSSDAILGSIQQQHGWLPNPTMVVSSGNGYHLQWIFRKPVFNNPATNDRVPTWQVTQDIITDLLVPWGADTKVRDVTRVLRLVGSVNDKNGALVTAVLDTGGAVDFAKFAKLVKRNQPAPIVVERFRDTLAPLETATRAKRLPRNYATPETAGRAKLSDYKLALDRMGDYATLAELRGAPLQDCRSRLLYAYACSGAWYWSSRGQAIHQLNQFSRDYFADHKRYGAKRVGTVLDRMGKSKRGERVEWEGKRTDPRYKMTNARIIKDLEITSEEQADLKTIISPSEKARRYEEKRPEYNRRRRQRRREQGKMTRDEYLSTTAKTSQERSQEAVRLKSEGHKQADIARMMGVSQPTVSRLLKMRQE